MEPESIGISDIMERVLRKPEKFARFIIAPMVLKLLAKETRQHSEGRPASVKDAVIMSDLQPTEAQIEGVSAIVTAVLQEYSR
jgi:ribosome maturation factor RimP